MDGGQNSMSKNCWICLIQNDSKESFYHLGEGDRLHLFPVTGNRHGQVTDPKGDQFSRA